MTPFSQPRFCVLKLLTLSNLIYSGCGGVITCDANECAGNIMDCADDGNTCALSCAANGCNGATLNCANGYDCDIVLSGDDAGNNMIINGNNATRLDITTGSGFTNQLHLSNIFCPPNADCIIRCIGDGATSWTCDNVQIRAEDASYLKLECGNNNNACDFAHVWCPDNGLCLLSGQPDTSAMTNMQIHSIQGFRTITVENGNTANSIGLLKCTQGYHQLCNIDANPDPPTGNSNNVCVGYPHICDNPPTATPTVSPITSNPTTSIPTTFSPTTSIPTTSIPTTSNPTTIPTKSPSRFPSQTPSNNPTISPSNIPTITPSIYPTKQPTFKEGEIKDTENENNDSNDKEQINANDNENQTVLFIVIAVAVVVFICILIGFIFWLIYRNKKRKNKRQIMKSVTGQFVVEMEAHDNMKGQKYENEIEPGAPETHNVVSPSNEQDKSNNYTNEGNNNENENKNNKQHVETDGRWYSPDVLDKKQEDDIYSDEMIGIEPIIKKEDKWKHAYILEKTPQHEQSIHNDSNNQQERTIGNDFAQITSGGELHKGDSDNNNNEHNST
eukprot:422106_1